MPEKNSKEIFGIRFWFTAFFLAGIFFLVTHDPFISQRLAEITPGNFNEVESAKVIAEGSISRKVGLLLMGLFGAVSLLGTNRQVLKRQNGSLGWLMLIFLLWAYLSVSWADDVPLCVRRLSVLTLIILGALGVALCFDFDEMILLMLVISTILLVVGILMEIVLNTFHPLDPAYRFMGTVHPNSQGANCAMLLLCAIYFLLKQPRRWIFWVAIAAALIFLILTKSRTALASAILASTFLLILILPLSKKLFALWGAGIIIILLFFFMGSSSLFTDVGKGMLLGREDSDVSTVSGRSEVWEIGLKYFSRRPYLGYGYESFWTPARVAAIDQGVQWDVTSGHSMYLDTLLTLGPFGLLIFILILLTATKKAVSYYYHSADYKFAFIACLLLYVSLNGLLESDIILPASGFLFIISLIILGFTDSMDRCKDQWATNILKY